MSYTTTKITKIANSIQLDLAQCKIHSRMANHRFEVTTKNLATTTTCVLTTNLYILTTKTT